MKKYSAKLTLPLAVLALALTTKLLAEPPPPTGLTVKYELQRDASVSLGLFDADGHLLRYLQQAEFTRKGVASVAWDGLDQYGQPLPVGNYVVKGVWYGPVTLAHDATVNNPGTPPWPTADDHGDWLGDESSPQAAVSDGDWVFLGSPCCEDGFSLAALNADGQRQWGFKSHYCPRSVALAVDDKYLYALYSGPGFVEGNTKRLYTGDNAVGRTILYCFDKKTGRMANFSKNKPGLVLTTWPYQDKHYFWWDLIREKNFSAATNGGQPRYSCGDVSESTNSLGIAALKGRIYIGYFYDGKVVEYDAETAEPTGLEIPVPAVVGLHAYDDHTLLAVSETQVVKIDLAKKVVASFITSGLVAPMYATSDQAGNVFVSDWKDSFQVKQFDKSGKFVKAIGTKGGRPWLGKWDAQGMLLPRGVAVDGKNQLWVAEDDSTPRRVSVWDSVSGKLARDYIGPASYGGGGYSWLDPQDRTKAVSNATRFDVDYAKKTGSPTATVYRKLDILDCFVPNGADTSKPARVLYHGKDEFFFTPNDRNTQYVLMKREGEVYKQAAAFGYHNWERHLVGDGTGKPQWDSDIGYHSYSGFYPDFFKEHWDDWFVWQDADDDRRTQEKEMRWLKPVTGKYDEGGLPKRFASGWGGDIDRDFTFYFGVSYADAQAIVRLPVKSWTAGGAPIYDLADARPVVKLDRAYHINGVYVTRDDKIMVTFSHEQQKMKDAIACFDKKAGRELWTIAMPGAEQMKGHNVHGTGVTFDYEVPGLGVVCSTWSWHGACKTYLFTTSGDYLDAPLTDHTSAGPFSAWGESFRGGAQYGDDKYLLNGGSGALHILKINGLNGSEVGRFEIPYKIDQAMVKQAEAFRNLPKPRVIPPPIVRAVWQKTPPVIDGKLDDWTPGECALLDKGDGRKAEIFLARDQNYLYLAARVFQATPPLRNGGADWQRLFLTGDCVDLMLRTAADADARAIGSVPGDERLLLSVFEDQPVAVLYQPVVSGSDKAPVQMLATSIDKVTRLANAKIQAVRNSGHYIIEAAIPLADLNLDPKNYDAMRGDVGVIFADGSGRNRALRLYYYNHSLNTGIVNDLTTEATLQPGEWGKIQLPLGDNLLADAGFENAGFADSERDGWVTHGNDNGASVTVSGSVSYSGRQSAYFHVDQPLDIPKEAYFKAPGYPEFLGAARGGQNTKGRIHAGIHQRVPVIGGHQYSARISYLTYDMQEESHRHDESRGLAKFNAGVRWQIPPPNRKEIYGNLGGAGGQNYDQWRTVKDYGSWFISQPFTAPDDATEAVITFDIDVRTGDRKSEAYLDNVEFVDITERDKASQ